MTGNDTNTTRRQLLATIVAAPLVAAPAFAATSPAIGRAAWDRAFAAMTAAKRTHEQESARFDPIYDSYRRAVDAVPHVTLRPDPYSGRYEAITTADPHMVRQARVMVRDLSEGRRRHDPLPDLLEHERLHRELVAAADARDAKIKKIDNQLGYSAAAERAEQACTFYTDAAGALLDIPSPDGPALLWKMEYLWLGDEEAGWAAEVVSLVLADARRFLSEGRC